MPAKPREKMERKTPPAAMPPPSVDDRWWEGSLARRLLPATVESILVNGLNGDLTDQTALFNLMLDTWPHLQRNVKTLREAVQSAPFEVHPWSDDDGTPVTDSAQKKAALVTRGLWGTTPDLTKMELTFEGMIGSQAMGTVMGHAIHEILWETRQEVSGMAILPRAFRRTAARFYGYPMGQLQQARGDGLAFRTGGRYGSTWTDFPLHQFITGIYPGHEGHPSVAAPLRSLAKYWIAATFGPEWLLSYAQLFGQPFRWATYRQGDKAAKEAISTMLGNIGSAGWAAFPEGTKLELHEASKAAGELPQKLIIDLANDAANILVLGQTLTSDTGDAGGGSYALGKVHTTVRREILSAAAGCVAATLTHQLARAIIALNYGSCTECPEIRASLPEVEDEKGKAERDQILLAMGMTLPMEWLHERHGVPMPDEDEPTVSKLTPPIKGDLPAKEQDMEKKPEEDDGDDKEQEAPTVAAAKAVLPASFIEILTETNQAVLEHAYAAGWEMSQITVDVPDTGENKEGGDEP